MQRRRLALLALLTVAGRRGLTRDRLIAWLWPDADPERARHLLSDSVYRINQALDGDVLLAAGEDLRLNPDRITADVWEFGEAIEREDWERAVSLQAAPFLDGFFVPDSGEFDRWADAERERLRRDRARALEGLARRAESSGDDSEAVRWWRLQAADDPYSSRVALFLMRALERAGDRAAAVQHARIHCVLVRDELGVEPDPEIQRLEERLRTGAQSAPAPSVPPAAPASSVPESDEMRSPTPSREPTLHAASAPLPAGDALQRAQQPTVRKRSSRSRLAVGSLAAVLLIIAAALVWRGRRDAVPAPIAEATSIAVLPFEDLSPGRDREYLADGITEELLVRLSKVDGFHVIGRTSSFAFKGRDLDVKQVAAQLGVSVVLGGSVLESGDRLRIFAQLIDATTGYQLWSDRYEREREDIFEIQDEIARAIVARLRGQLAVASVPVDRSVPTDDPDAYNLYLRGRFEWHKRTEQGLRNAAAYLRQATERAPEYARAFAGLGDAYAVLGFYDYMPPAEAFPRARQAADRALEIDPELAEPHATLGYVALYYEWDWVRAEAEFRRTIDLDPGYSTGHQWFANYLTAMSRYNEAVREMRAAQDLDPLSLIANAALGWVMYYAGDYERALEQLRQTLELDARFELAHLWRGLSFEQLGRSADAIAELETAVDMSGGSAISVAALARTHAVAGDTANARSLIRRLEARGDSAYIPAFEMAKIHEALGDPAATFRWLDRAFAQRSHSLVFLASDPQLRRLHGDPEFDRLVRQVGLDQRPPPQDVSR